MFDLLKNKIKSFTNKVLGKAKEKEAQEQILEKEIPEEAQEQILEKEIPEEEAQEQILKKEIPAQEEAEPLEKTNEVPEPVSKVKSIKDKTSLTLEEITKKDLKNLDQNTKIPETESKTTPEQIDTIFTDSKKDLKQPTIETDQVNELNYSDSLNKTNDQELETKKEELDEKKVPEFTEESIDLRKEEIPKILKETEKEQKPTKQNIDSNLNIEKKKDLKKSLFTSLKSIFSNKIKLSEKEITDFLDEFELSLLEADVSIKSAEAIVLGLKKRLTESSFDKGNILEDIKTQIKIVLKEELNIDCNIENYFSQKKEDQPYIILFIGPNGVGKTTTIAKLAYKFKAENKSVVFASSDTFRAGSIDQLEKHANNIGVRIVKQNYGSDPAAVAYDAVLSAKANKTDFVLIDTAGRQETNHNLMEELKKIKRVVNPDLIIYIGEAQAGQAITEQIKKFDTEIGIDGVILTKIDTDPKGGVAISILNEFKKPIFFIGTGQEYENLDKFSADYIIERIV